MIRYSLISLSLALALSLGSCGSKSSLADDFDNSKVNVGDMRAREKSNTLAGSEKIAEVNLNQHEEITSYTELVQGKLNATVEIEKDAEVRLNVIDQNGKLLQTFAQASVAGLNQYQLDFSEMSLGQYYVVLLSDNMYRRFCVAKTQ